MHPTSTRRALKIKDVDLDDVTESDSPVDFWQLSCPASCILRVAALRISVGKASSLGVERLWSGARAILTDCRRLMHSIRLMQLLNCKMNMHLLCDSTILESLGVKEQLSDANVYSLFEECERYEEEEQSLALALDCSSDGDGGQDVEAQQVAVAEELAEDELDLFQ